MSKAVDLLSYWMPLLRNLKEFKEIAKAEEPELRYLLNAVEQTLSNMFIDLSNEAGISRFEQMLKIVPNLDDTIETRRFRVLSKWNKKEVYTDETLEELLTSLCGEGNYEIIRKYDEYFLKIITKLSVKDAFETVSEVLQEILPCNLVLELANTVKELSGTVLYVSGLASTAMVYEFINTSDSFAECSTVPYLYVGGIATTAMLYGFKNSADGGAGRITVHLPIYSAVTNSIGITTEIITQE